MFEKYNPKMLRFRPDTNALDMLINYTIFPDLKFYYVSPDYFYNPESQYVKTNDFQKHPLRRSRINTKITHALEAERCLQNIHVKVADVWKQINDSGDYTPPGIFMKYFGYVYFTIRKKPIIIDNLKNA